jgi:hypothetical protein
MEAAAACGSEMAISRAGSRLFDMTEELKILFTSEESVLADLLSDEIGGSKVASLPSISQGLNTLNGAKMLLLQLINL